MDPIHVEIPAGGLPLLEVPVALIPDITDETTLTLTYGPFPGLPSLEILTLTDSGSGIAAHVEIPPGSNTALIEIGENPPALDLQDEEDLQPWPGVPTAVLVLLKHRAP